MNELIEGPDAPAHSLITLSVSRTHPRTPISQVDVIEGPDVSPQGHSLL